MGGTATETMENPELFDYGIHNEATDIRAHVGVVAKTCYVFPTKAAVAVMSQFSKAKAFQPGVEYATAEGHKVPWSQIPHIRRVRLDPDWIDGFDESLSTTDKGTLAVGVVRRILRAGKFPLWFDGFLVSDVGLQINGEDIHVNGKWKIQVKCDYRCGETERGGTGNIYIQIRERNPLHHV